MSAPPSGPYVDVLAPGPFATLQDLGRPGYAELGIGRAGAADRSAHRLANRLVGNPEALATIECTLGGLALRVSHAVLFAVTGAGCPVFVDGRSVDVNAPVSARAGQVVRLGFPPAGLRSYLAVRGGFRGDEVLGSCSRDTFSEIGPPPLSEGDRIRLGPLPAGSFAVADLAPQAATPPVTVLHPAPGPYASWFAPWVAGVGYTVGSDSNRVAVRLQGPALRRVNNGGDIVPEALVPGAIQVPPNGLPVIFLADHPTTGGYPIVGVLPRAEVDLLAQQRPGDPLTLAALPTRDGLAAAPIRISSSDDCAAGSAIA